MVAYDQFPDASAVTVDAAPSTVAVTVSLGSEPPVNVTEPFVYQRCE